MIGRSRQPFFALLQSVFQLSTFSKHYPQMKEMENSYKLL